MKKLYALSISCILLNQAFSEVIETNVKPVDASFLLQRDMSVDSPHLNKESFNFVRNDQSKPSLTQAKRRVSAPISGQPHQEKVAPPRKFSSQNTSKSAGSRREENVTAGMRNSNTKSLGSTRQLEESKRWVLEKRKQLNSKQAELAKKEKELSSLEEEFLDKHKLLTEREHLLFNKEEELKDRQVELVEIEEFLTFQETEFTNVKEKLAVKEVELLEKELECIEKEKLLISKEEELVKKEKLLMTEKNKQKK